MPKFNIPTKVAGESVAATEFNAIVKEINTEVYFLSKHGAVSDANLAQGQSTAGATNSTAAIQAILDKASATNPIKVVCDGRFATDGMFIGDNTEIEVLAGCGFILRNGSHRSLIMNKNTSFNPAARVEKNIVIRGGIWNGNILNQSVKGTSTYGLCGVFHFAGVENLTIEKVEVRDMKTYAFAIWNIGNERVSHVKIIANPAQELNTDGVHADGNCDNVHFSNIEFLGFDDAIACNADDGYYETGAHYTYPFYSNTKPANNGYNANGPIKNVVLENLYLRPGGWYGVRVLGVTQRIENFTARNISGETYGKWLELNNAGLPGAGNLGNVSVEDVNVKVTGTAQLYTANIDTGIERLTISKHIRHHYEAGKSTFNIGMNGNVKTFVLEQLDHYDEDSLDTDEIIVVGYIETLIIRNCKFKKAAPSASTLIRVTTGTIKRLILSDVEVENYNNLVRYEGGNMSFIQANNITHTGAETGEGSFHVAAGKTLTDLEVNSYFGYLIKSGGGTFSKSRGYALAAAFELPAPLVTGDAEEFEDVIFTRFVNDTLVNTNGVWTSAVNDNVFGHKGQMETKLFPAGGNAKLKLFAHPDTDGVQFGFNADVPPGQPYVYAGIQILGGTVTTISDGVNLGSVVDNNWYQIVKTGSAFKLQRSADDITYTDIHTFPQTWNNNMWAMVDIGGGPLYSLHNPKAQGLV